LTGNAASQRSILKAGFTPTEKVMIDWPDGTQGLEARYEMDLEKLRAQSADPKGP